MDDCATCFEMGSPQSKCRLRDLKAATGFAKCNLSVKQSVSYGFTGYLIFKQLRVLVIGIQNVGTVEKKVGNHSRGEIELVQNDYII